MTSAIEVRDLIKRYPTTWWGGRARAAIDRVDLTIADGEGVALVGPNGAGKSTLLMLFSGLRRPSDGSVRVRGLDPLVPENRRGMGVLPDRPALHPELTAHDHLMLVAAAHELADADVRIAEVMGRLALGPAAEGAVGTLSAGMQKRVALGMAMVHGPGLLLLDEPLTALDPASVRIVTDALAEERGRGVTLVIATHRLAELVGCCDRVVQVQNGMVQRLGSVEAVLVRLPVRVVYTLPPGGADPEIGTREISPPGISIRVAAATRRDSLVEQIRAAGGAVLRVSPMMELLTSGGTADIEETLA